MKSQDSNAQAYKKWIEIGYLDVFCVSLGSWEAEPGQEHGGCAGARCVARRISGRGSLEALPALLTATVAPCREVAVEIRGWIRIDP